MNPYKINGPALISFSGGRTSAYMLYQIIQAHGGKLPDDVVVCFANTGKERPETLRFVHECQTRWGVDIHWLEWRRGKPIYEEVGFNSASRQGEPFADLIEHKQRLPNGFERWCTEFLKVRIMFAFIADKLGMKQGEFTEVIGLRDDEGIRILKGMEAAERHGRRVAYPLAKSKITKKDIWTFWLGENRDPKRLTHPLPQGFDLGLYPWEGNCTLCFQKGKGIRKRIIRDDPNEALWWIRQEVSQSGWFDKRDLVADLLDQVLASPSFFDADDDMEYDVECGSHCAMEIAA